MTGALLALIAWGALSFGAVYPWAYWPLAAGSVVIGVHGITRYGMWHDQRARAVTAVLCGTAVAIALQLVPIPYRWFQLVSPAGDRLLGQLQFGWLARPPDTHGLSIDPGSTLTALCLFVAGAVLLIGLMRSLGHAPLFLLVNRLTIFGAVLAVIGIVQRVVAGPSDLLIYGFWKPSGLATPFGPFVNRNHFAGWMVMMLPLACAGAAAHLTRGTGSERRDPNPAPSRDSSPLAFLIPAILVMAMAVVLTGSRSGLASLIIALGVLAWMIARRIPRRRMVPALAFGLLMVAAIGWAGVARTAARFDKVSEEFAERVSVWRDTVRVIHDFPVAGTGIGSFEAVMLAYQTADRQSIYAQAHNEYLQVLAEGGGLVAVPVLLAVIVVWLAIRHRLRRGGHEPTYWLRAGAIAGLAGIAAQSLVEFSLHMPGNAALFVVLLAIALHRPASGGHAHRV